MPGIFGTSLNKTTDIMQKENRIYSSLKNDKWYIELSSIKKFENDKVLYEDEQYIILIDGVILNLKRLKEEYKEDKIENVVIKIYNELGDEFFNIFRGNFCGFLMDKKKDKAFVFTNQTGDKTIYYYENNGTIIFASEIKHIIKTLKQNNIKYTLDKSGVYSLITYGYMYDNLTLIQEIKRLLPGHYIKIENKKIENKEYYRIKNIEKELNESEDVILENIDMKFKEAIRLQLLKNEEYGYEDYAPLSAGLDSRMTNYVIKDITDKPIYNMTYSQINQLDEKIPARISIELKNHWIFKNLDNGLALYAIDKSLEFTDGCIYYAWPSQLYDYMKLLNTDNIGVVHTGVIGDVIIGTFFKKMNKNKYKVGDGAYSKKLIKKLEKLLDVREYENFEIGMMYNRAFNGAVLGYSTTFQQYTEAMSPFMNIEFMEYCLSLPLKYRLGHDIYYKWVRKYYPEAAKYSHNGMKIPGKSLIKIKWHGKRCDIGTILSILREKVKIKFNKQYNMNPMQYWYDTNPTLKNIMDKYYKQNIDLLKENDELKQDMIELYENGIATEKIQVITVLSFINKFFKEI